MLKWACRCRALWRKPDNYNQLQRIYELKPDLVITGMAHANPSGGARHQHQVVGRIHLCPDSRLHQRPRRAGTGNAPAAPQQFPQGFGLGQAGARRSKALRAVFWQGHCSCQNLLLSKLWLNQAQSAVRFQFRSKYFRRLSDRPLRTNCRSRSYSPHWDY